MYNLLLFCQRVVLVLSLRLQPQLADVVRYVSKVCVWRFTGRMEINDIQEGWTLYDRRWMGVYSWLIRHARREEVQPFFNNLLLNAFGGFNANIATLVVNLLFKTPTASTPPFRAATREQSSPPLA